MSDADSKAHLFLWVSRRYVSPVGTSIGGNFANTQPTTTRFILQTLTPQDQHAIDTQRVVFNDASHRYYLPYDCTTCDATGRVDGAREGTTKNCPTCKGDGYKKKYLTSVTTILSELNKPALPAWAAKMGAAAAFEYLRDHAGETITEDTALIVENIARTAHDKQRDQAAEKGSAVHDAIHEYQTDIFEAGPPEDEDAATAWWAFQNFIESEKFEIVECERLVLDRTHRYAGRMDLLLRRGRDYYVADVKTSNGVYAEHVLQNAAYANAIRSELGLYGLRSMVIHLPTGATSVAKVERSPREVRADFRVFESLLKVRKHRPTLETLIRSIRSN